jgi:hypothetical protein
METEEISVTLVFNLTMKRLMAREHFSTYFECESFKFYKISILHTFRKCSPSTYFVKYLSHRNLCETNITDINVNYISHHIHNTFCKMCRFDNIG